MSSNRPIDIPGMLRGYLALGFCLLHCLCEIIDNAESAGASTIRLTFDVASMCIIISDNGNGMTRQQMIDALRHFKDSNPSVKHGRYGIGLKIAIAMLSKLLTKITFLTRSIGIEEPLQEEVDFPAIMASGTMPDINPRDISRSTYQIWKEHAINEDGTGTVIYIPCEENVFHELRSMTSSSELKTSLRYQLGLTYQGYFERKNKMFLRVGDKEEIDILHVDFLLFDQLSADDKMEIDMDIWQDPIQSHDIRAYFVNPFIKETKNKKTNQLGYLSHDKTDFEAGSPPVHFQKLGPVKHRGAYLEDWIEEKRPFLESIGITVPGKGEAGRTQFNEDLCGIALVRNKKIISVFPPNKGVDGNTAGYKYTENAVYTVDYCPIMDDVDYSAGTIPTLDSIFKTQVNKSRVDPQQIEKNVWSTSQYIHKKFATNRYYKSPEYAESQAKVKASAREKREAAKLQNAAASSSSSSSVSPITSSSSSSSASSSPTQTKKKPMIGSPQEVPLQHPISQSAAQPVSQPIPQTAVQPIPQSAVQNVLVERPVSSMIQVSGYMRHTEKSRKDEIARLRFLKQMLNQLDLDAMEKQAVNDITTNSTSTSTCRAADTLIDRLDEIYIE